MGKLKLTQEELISLLKSWQKRLLLDDWNLSIDIVEFTRKDYPQSGDIDVYPEQKKAIVLISDKPFKPVEYVIVHELIHLLLWDYDKFSEDFVLRESKRTLENQYQEYMLKLEFTVDHITRAFLDQKNKRGK